MKKVYRAVRTSEFMPFDQGNAWIVSQPNGQIHVLENGEHRMKQNEAIRLSKELNNKA